MRATFHNGRVKSGGANKGRAYSAKHNDRNYDFSKAENIDATKTTSNIYWRYNQSDVVNQSFEECELEFYKKYLSKQLEKTNNNYIKNRHPERVKRMEVWMKQKNHCPEEVVRQIGNKDESISQEKLIEIEKTYEQKFENWNKKHGVPFFVLDRAYHFDEATPHIQERGVWLYFDDKDNVPKIGQEKALEKAGVELPNPDEPVGKNNNRKMTFSKICRDFWLEACEENGLKVEKEPILGVKHNLEKEEYITEKYKNITRENEQLKQENNVLQWYESAYKKLQNMFAKIFKRDKSNETIYEIVTSDEYFFEDFKNEMNKQSQNEEEDER